MGSERRPRRAVLSKWTPWVFLILGLLVLGYPSLASYFEHQRDIGEITDFRAQELTPEQIAAQQDAINAYNDALNQGQFNSASDPFGAGAASEATSSYFGTGEMLFVLHVPKIDLALPTYFGATDLVLSLGAGLLENTSFPGSVGGHSVISAHRGMYNQPMFRHVDKLQAGDVIYLELSDRVLKYVVTGQQLVLPHETSVITQDPELDQLTLLTCHPFPVNDQRLLINATRAEITPAEIASINPALVPGYEGQPSYRNLHDVGRWLTETSPGQWVLSYYPVFIVLGVLVAVAGLRLVLVAARRKTARKTGAPESDPIRV